MKISTFSSHPLSFRVQLVLLFFFTCIFSLSFANAQVTVSGNVTDAASDEVFFHMHLFFILCQCTGNS